MTERNSTSRRSPGDRKQKQRKNKGPSLNHLLNFTLPERSHEHSASPLHACEDDDRVEPIEVSYVPYRKEKFVNANFRFLLSAQGNYAENTVDPDACFDWDAIEQVLISAYRMPACPICLSEDPLAARVSRCGHVFCLPCILHYFDLAEENTPVRDCPVCGDAITAAEDLKHVKKIDHPVAVRLQEPVRLVLMHRPAGSMFSMPTTAPALPQQNNFIPTDRTPMALTYARFMLASPDYMTAEYAKDTSELTDAMARLSLPEDNEELVSITSGLKHIEVERAQPPLAMKRRGPRRHESNGGRRDSGGMGYYYFQAADGQLVFLHPQQIRVLRHEFGDYQYFPELLESRVISMEERTLDEVYRKRYKYLGHLPVGSGVTLVKVDLSGIVSGEVLAAFPEANEPHEEKDQTVAKDEAEEDEEDEVYAQNRRRGPDDDRSLFRDESFVSTSTNIEEMDEDELLDYVLRLSQAEQ